MQTNDFERFKNLLADVHGFYQRDVSNFALSVWWESTRLFDFDAFSQALNRHVMNPDSGQFMPKPADIVKMMQGTTQDSALVAWMKVDRAVRHVGTWEDVVFDDALIHRVLHDMGGWIAFGEKKENEWPFVAKEFENRYRGFKSRNEQPSYPQILTGICHSINQQNFTRIDLPILIGDKTLAAQVMSLGTDQPMLQFSRVRVSESTSKIMGLQFIDNVDKSRDA